MKPLYQLFVTITSCRKFIQPKIVEISLIIPCFTKGISSLIIFACRFLIFEYCVKVMCCGEHHSRDFRQSYYSRKMLTAYTTRKSVQAESIVAKHALDYQVPIIQRITVFIRKILTAGPGKRERYGTKNRFLILAGSIVLPVPVDNWHFLPAIGHNPGSSRKCIPHFHCTFLIFLLIHNTKYKYLHNKYTLTSGNAIIPDSIWWKKHETL